MNTLNKVPPVILIFWVIKIMSTTVGETGADYLAVSIGPGTVAFWLAYIITRPLGASLGDFLSQATTYGGLGFGVVYTSLKLC